MGAVTAVLAILCAAAVLAAFVKCCHSPTSKQRHPTFTFGGDRSMPCACPLCKEAQRGVRPDIVTTEPPVSGRSSRRRGHKLAGEFAQRKRVAVVGAGPAGASAARQLAERGHSVVVFEAASDVGGRTYTMKQQGYHQFDSGAGFFTNFYPLLTHYIAALNLSRQVMPLSRTNMLVHQLTGHSYALSLGALGSFFRLPFLGLMEKLRFLAYTAWLWCRRSRFDLVDPAVLARYDTTSVSLEASRSLGQRAYETLVRPGIEAFWYFSCREASSALFTALTAEAATAQFFTLGCGMDWVVRRLLTHPNIIVRCDAPVVKLTDDLRVTYGRGDAVGVDKFQAIVVATTADQAARLVQASGTSLEGTVHPDIVAYLRSQRYAANVHGAFTVGTDRLSVPRTVASYFPCGPGPWTTAAVAFTHTKVPPGVMQPGRDGVQVYLMDEPSQALLKQYPPQDATAEDDTSQRPGHAHTAPTSGVAKQVWQRARELCPSLPTYDATTCAAVFARRHALPIPEVGRYKLAAQVDSLQGSQVVFAGDYLSTGTVEGALRSGMRAALLVHGQPAM